MSLHEQQKPKHSIIIIIINPLRDHEFQIIDPLHHLRHHFHSRGREEEEDEEDRRTRIGGGGQEDEAKEEEKEE